MSKLISKILKESLYEGPNPNEEEVNDSNPTTFVLRTKPRFEITYLLQSRPSEIKREREFVSADITNVINKDNGRPMKVFSNFQAAADTHGRNEIEIGNESQYGI